MVVILDNGHGCNTRGKCSPVWGDSSQLFEWEFNRDIVNRIEYGLNLRGIVPYILVEEEADISLSERVSRCNAIARKHKNEAILISVHANAGRGTGWECFTSVGKTDSDGYATIFYEVFEEEFKEFRMRKDMTDGDPDKEAHFYILKNTSCPAILTENFFMDTKRDCDFIMSEVGRQRIADAHIKAILDILEQ